MDTSANPMMPPGIPAELARAILVDRSDDTPRLVLADWLDDHSRPERAEFIRVQCEIGRAEAGGLYGVIPRLRYREKQLWDQFGEHWRIDENPLVPGCIWPVGGWRRGFTQGVILTNWRAFYDDFGDTFVDFPGEAITLSFSLNSGMNLGDFAHWPALATIRELNIRDAFTAVHLDAIEHSPFFDAFDRISFERMPESVAMMTRVARFLRGRKRSLSIRETELTRPRIEGLFRPLTADNLGSLQLTSCRIDATRIAMLANLLVLLGLTALDLTDNLLRNDGLERLLIHGDFTNLRRLNLSNTMISDIELIAETPSLSGLHELKLAGNPIELDSGLFRLLPISLPELRSLDLSRCRSGPRLILIDQSPTYAKLEVLYLNDCGLTTPFMSRLSQLHCPRLMHLSLDGCTLNLEGVRILGDWLRTLPLFRSLSLARAQLTQDAERHLTPGIGPDWLTRWRIA